MRTQDEKLRALITEQAAEWHVAHSDGGLNPQQARAFMHWLRTSPVHVAEYLTIAGVADDVSEAARNSTILPQDLLADEVPLVRRFGSDTGDDGDNREISSPRAYRALISRGARTHRAARRPIVSWSSAVAAVFIVSIALFAGWRWYAVTPNVETFSTRHGEVRSLRLPDNTLVQLDSDSAITVRFSHENRLVLVDHGQAYFRVARDSGRPFSVRAGRTLIRDVGTAFDVYRRQSGTTISVVEGRVQVWSRQHHLRTKGGRWLSWFESEGQPRGRPIADLGAGQQVRIATSGYVMSLGSVNMQQALDWRHGRIAFDHEAVSAVAAEFNRYNDPQIIVQGSQISTLPISGVFDAHDVPTFVAFLDTLPDVRVERRGQRIIVFDDRQRQRRHD